MSLNLGMGEQMIESAIETRLSHIQLFKKGFYADKEINKTIPSGSELLGKIRQMQEVEAAVGRVKVTAMAASPVTGTGVMIHGVVPEDEHSVARIHEMLTHGTYFETDKRNPAVIGAKLAKKLKTKLGAKIVLTAQALDGDITAGAFRVVGIYKTPSSVFDGSAVFVKKADIDRILGLGGRIHEIAIMARDSEGIPDFAEKLERLFPQLEVLTWGELAPELEYTKEAMSQYLYIFMIVILLSLAFGIVNIMLMAVLERVRELGVLMAVGMKHGRIFAMIVLETVLLAISGAIIGMGLGAASIAYLGRTGIDLSIVSKGLASFGASEILYPQMALVEYPKLAVLVLVVAVLSAIYPAIKAVKINPVKAIRTY